MLRMAWGGGGGKGEVVSVEDGMGWGGEVVSVEDGIWGGGGGRGRW